ncbi:hypothetical protein FDENT_13005 [Fusarium denticulatum]|uniref:F-box domain-containing protein n=1 Tax=Fusarium denticulatum TaxID=48507 RepID=A0A8H5T7E5_9HYPO|nr:hypothetical protein FDENT_13005 [Fusarium denticulatum]
MSVGLDQLLPLFFLLRFFTSPPFTNITRKGRYLSASRSTVGLGISRSGVSFRTFCTTDFMMELQFTDPNPGLDILPEVFYDAESCGLCRFRFSEGDKITSCKDRERLTKLRRRNYRFLDEYVIPYHLECFEIVGRQSYHNVAFATWPGIQYEGPHHLADRRRRWLENTFAKDLFRTLRGRLPQDICQTIAVYFPRERAMQAFQQLWSQDHPRQPRNISVPVHCGVTLWAQYINYEGNQYIESFSYESRGGDEEIVLKWEPNTKKLHNVFIRHSGLGVTKIIVTEGEETPDVEHVEGFDGIKIRRLGVFKSADDFVEFHQGGPLEILWAVPAAPVKHSPKIPLPRGFGSQFVRAFDWNKPGTVGYSFFVLGSVILHVNSHQAGTPAAPEDYDRFAYGFDRCRRLYLAMSPGEIVSELWLRGYDEPNRTLIAATDHLAVQVVTNLGRSLVVGADHVGPFTKYHAVAKLPQHKPCRMFYAESIECHIGWLHFDSVSTWRHPEERQIQHPQGFCCNWTCHTSAKLHDVREVTPCVFRTPMSLSDDEKITGLLLSYTDGSRSSVGEIRPDRLGTPKAATSDTLFLQYQSSSEEILDSGGHLVESGLDWFGFSEPPSGAASDDGSDNIDEEPHEMIDDSHPEDNSSEEGDSNEPVRSTTTIAVPMRGRLDWILRDSDQDYALSYHKRSSPKDAMRQVLAEDATMPRQEPVTKSLSILVGILGESACTRSSHSTMNITANMSYN